MVSLVLGVVLVWWLLGSTSPLGPLPGTPITELSPEKGLARLRARAADPGADRQGLWRDVLAYRMKHAGTPEAAAAAELQMRLPSLLDQLDPARIKDKSGMPPEAVALVQGHLLAAYDLKFSPDGRYIALCGDETHRELAIYDLTGAEPRLLANLTGHTAHLNAVAFSPDGNLVASASADKTVRLWALTDVKPRSLRVLEGHTGNVTCLAFSPDGRMLASGSEDKTVRLWSLSAADPGTPSVLSITRGVRSVAISNDGKTLAVGCSDGSSFVQLWGLGERQPTMRQTWPGLSGRIAISPDGTILAESDLREGFVKVSDLTGPEPKGQRLSHFYDQGVRANQFTGDGKTLLTGDGFCRFQWWDPSSGKKLRSWNVALADVVRSNPSVDLAPDGRHLAFAINGNFLYILRVPQEVGNKQR